MRQPEEKAAIKPIVWIGDSLEIVRRFPPTVRDEIGFALYQAQAGGKHINVKPLKGLGPGILEVVSDYRGDTFRAVYTVRLEDKVYVLHAFQKNQKRELPRPSRRLTSSRVV
jgi:phage-related protein